MADDLMNFSLEVENSELSFVDEQDENDTRRAPCLVQSPVIMNSILKQSNKDNLIQLYTPIQKPEKGKLKVHFGSDSLLQTPTVKQGRSKKMVDESTPIKEVNENIVEGVKFQVEDNENFTKPADIVSKKHHGKVKMSGGTDVVSAGGDKEDGIEVAMDIVNDVIDKLPIKGDIDYSRTSADRGIDECPMEVSICETQAAEHLDYDQTNDILLQAELLLKSIQTSSSDSTDQATVKQTEETHDGIGETITGKHSNHEVTESEIQLSYVITEAGDTVADEEIRQVKENSMDEKCIQKTETLVANEEQAVPTGADNVEEPMDCEEPMELDDEDGEIVFNIGINRTADNSTVETAQLKDELLENEKPEFSNNVKERTATESADAVNEADGVSKNVDEDVKCNKYETDEVDNSKLNIIAHIDIERKEEVESKQDSSVDINESVQTENNTVIQKSTEVHLIEKNNEVDGCKVEELTKTGDDSSDEEFMSADEDMEVDEVKTPLRTLPVAAIETQETHFELKQESPDRIPPKVGYNLNFDDMDAMDPFGNKKSLINSPDLGKQIQQEVVMPVVHKGDSNDEISKSTLNDQVEAGDQKPDNGNASPDKLKLPKVEILMSPNAVLVDEVWRDKNAPNIFEEHPDCLLHDDDKQTCETGGLTQQNKSESEVKQLDFDVNSELDFDSMNPFKPKAQIINSPDRCKLEPDGSHDKLDEMDPFKPSKQIMNTPDIAEGQLSDITQPVEDVVVETAPLEVSEQRIADNDDKPNNAGMTIRRQREAVLKASDVGQPMESSPAIPITRGTYNLEALDEMDPFKSSKQMSNSPCVNSHAVVTNEVDPIKPKKLIVSTTNMDKPTNETMQDKMEPIKPSTQLGTDDMPEMSDYITKSKDKQQTASIVMPAVDIVCEEKVLDDITDPLKPTTQITNSSTKEMGNLCVEEMNAFKPKSQIQNSPVGKLPNIDVKSLNGECLDIIDPFKSKSQIQNSPALKVSDNNTNLLNFENLDDIETFQSKSQIQNSPAIKVSDNNTNLLNFENLDDVDTFQSKSQIQNSPAIKVSDNNTNLLNFENLDDVDTFQSKSQIQNSPAIKVSDNNTNLLNFENLDDIDTFQSKSQIQNSPADKISGTNANTLDFGNLMDTDQFKLQSTIKISPADKVIGSKVNTLDFESLDNIDPFKSTSQIQNSPLTKESGIERDTIGLEIADEIDPFKSKQQLQVSPASVESKETEVNGSKMNQKDAKHMDEEHTLTEKGTTEAFSNVDPFKIKKRLKMSPTTKPDPFADLNPFKTNNKVVATPEKTDGDSEIEVMGNLDTIENINPFNGNSTIANSPDLKTMEKNNPFVMQSRDANSPMKEDAFSHNTELPTTPPKETEGAANEFDDIFEVQGVTRRGQKGLHSDKFGDIDQSQFVPASQVFNDPAAWEMLEQLGNATVGTAESALSRMSLFVKFDPLVDEAPISLINPRRISIKVSQLEMVKEYGLDETLLLLGTPPNRRRQSVTAAQTRVTPSGSMRTPASSAQPSNKKTDGAVDLILAYSPKKNNKPMNKSSRATMSLLDDIVCKEEPENLFQELKYTDADLKRHQRDNELVMQGMLINKDKDWCKKEEQWKEENSKLVNKYKHVKEDRDKLEQAFLYLEQKIYEIAALRDAAEKKVKEVKEEKEQSMQDIVSVETAFSDLHRRYEKARNVMLSMKKNEDILKKVAEESLQKEEKINNKYHALEKSTQEKLTTNKVEIESQLQQQRDGLQSKFDAQMKITQIKIANLETSIERKTEENKQLTEICENLLTKVGQ